MRSARDYAIVAHGTQMYGEYHYSKHLDDVYDICWNFITLNHIGKYAGFVLNNCRKFCYLHDIIEDTNTTYYQLAREFDADVAMVVYMISCNKELEGRKAKYAFLYKMFNEVYKDNEKRYAAKLLKSCDRLANVRFSFETHDNRVYMYRKEHEEFKNVFYDEDFKELYDEMEIYFAKLN